MNSPTSAAIDVPSPAPRAPRPRRVALVTGGSSGIGFAIARMLIEDGYALSLTARHSDRLTGAARALRKLGGEVLVLAADLAEEQEIRGTVDRHAHHWGRLDVLVNNAGIDLHAPVSQLATSRLDALLTLNLRTPILLYRECAQLLREAGAQHGNALVVNTASITGKSGQPEIGAYSASKAALIGWTQSMNRELGASGIKSLALCPGLVDTAMTEHARAHVPRDHMITPEDIAEAVRFALRLSPQCVVPEIVFQRPGEGDNP